LGAGLGAAGGVTVCVGDGGVAAVDVGLTACVAVGALVGTAVAVAIAVAIAWGVAVAIAVAIAWGVAVAIAVAVANGMAALTMNLAVAEYGKMAVAEYGKMAVAEYVLYSDALTVWIPAATAGTVYAQ
jgi:hypothetical protein